jgi:hypothetical protein
MTPSLPLPLIAKRCFLGGLILLALCAACGLFFPTLFFEGYLTAFILWIGFPLGCLPLLFLQYLTGGRWGLAITRLLEAGTLTLPLGALLFLPVLVGMPWLYPWLHPRGAVLPQLVQAKSAYLNVPFFVIRSAIYFAVLSALAFRYRQLSLRRDDGDAIALASMKKWSGPSLIVFVLLMNFASIDWIMSLNPEWYSSMFVVEFVTENALAALAACVLALRCLAHLEPVRGILTVKIVHDLGNLLLAFTCFWTYVTFSEFLIVWTGNLPHDVVWFSDRSSGGWKIFAVLLVFVHFVIPLFCLILTTVSRNLVRLARVAVLLLAAHFVQVVWWIEPAFGKSFHIAWTSLVLIAALGALGLAAFLRQVAAAPLVLKEIPRREEEAAA